MADSILKQDRNYLVNKFQKPVFDPETGLDNETIKTNMMALVDELGDLPHQVLKGRAFEYVTRNVQIDVNPCDWFVGFGCWDRRDWPLLPLRKKWDDEVNNESLETWELVKEQNASGSSLIWKDCDHSAPDWDAVFSLGFPGLRERAKRYRRERETNGEMTDEARAYFDGIDITYGSIIEMLERFRAYALEHADGDKRMLASAECLNTLIHGAPTNTFEVLQLIYLFFIFGEYFDTFQVRSLSNLDRKVYPYYLNDLQSGKYDLTQIREFFAYFMMQLASIDNYYGHPFYLGGTKENGESEINELSYLILDVFDELNVCSPKIQLKIASNTPAEFINKALDMIRRGRSSLVFVSEASIKRILTGIGCTEEESRTCDITGCYEFIPRGRGNGTIIGRINMLKAVELVFHNGTDPLSKIECGVKTGELDEIKTFDDFTAAYLRQLEHTIETIILCANEFEQYLSHINPAQVYSATIENSLKTARDAFQDGSIYNFTTIALVGLAIAVDSLMVVKELVYEKRELTLAEFREILKRNWEGHEKLRLKIIRGKNKFGNGIDHVDEFAEKIARHLSERINGRPNGRNGVYLASAHSARHFIFHGQKTGATPDGRVTGEEVSKNISPSMGMDINGVTALIKSVTRIDSALFPGDFPLDVMMHPTSVQGEEGLIAMRRLLDTYMRKHGIAIQFNIFDSETLLDAQKYPDKHQGLQVRVCGWNVRFNDLSEQEQDAYIRRATNMAI